MKKESEIQILVSSPIVTELLKNLLKKMESCFLKLIFRILQIIQQILKILGNDRRILR